MSDKSHTIKYIPGMGRVAVEKRNNNNEIIMQEEQMNLALNSVDQNRYNIEWVKTEWTKDKKNRVKVCKSIQEWEVQKIRTLLGCGAQTSPPLG